VFKKGQPGPARDLALIHWPFRIIEYRIAHDRRCEPPHGCGRQRSFGNLEIDPVVTVVPPPAGALGVPSIPRCENGAVSNGTPAKSLGALAWVLSRIGGAQRMAGQLSQDANAIAADAARIIDEVLEATAKR